MKAIQIRLGLPNREVELELRDQQLFFKGNPRGYSAAQIASVSYPKKNRVRMVFQDASVGELEIDFPNIAGYLHDQLGPLPEHFSVGQKLQRRSVPLLLILLGSVLGLVLLVWLVLIPWMANAATVRFPVEQEIALGEQMAQQYLAAEAVDSAASRDLQHFASKLKVNSASPFRFYVVRSETVNAYALPGGTVVVYSGILKGMQQESELAALLAHEMSHVLLRHSLRNIFRELSASLILQTFLGDLGGMQSELILEADRFRGLSYSRELETEADLNGLKIMTENRVALQGMLSLMQQLKAQESVALPEFVSTHPLPETRLEAIAAEITRLNPPSNSDTLAPWVFQKLKAQLR